MPRTKKPAGQAADPRNGRRAELAIPDGGRLERFELPAKRPAWLPESVAAWDGAWSDPIAQAWTAGDRPLLLRWVDALDRSWHCVRRADRKPVVLGGNGQVTEHPSYATAAKFIGIAEKCEQQLGFGALNRERLGFTIGAARKSLGELNAKYVPAAGGDDDEPDPRAIAGGVDG